MTLSEIPRNDYPTEYLKECHSALCLFGAGFHGANDVIHMYDADVRSVSVVDIDEEKMDWMKIEYPMRYKYYNQDVFDFINSVKGPTWDIVSVDPPTALFNKCLERLPELMWLSNKYVAITCWDQHLQTSIFDNFDVVSRTIRSYSAMSVVALVTKPS